MQSVHGGTGAVTITAAGLNITAGNVSGLANVATSGSKNDVGLSNVGNHSPANQLINGWSTTITAGQLELGNNSGARIRLDATSSAPRIEVYDS